MQNWGGNFKQGDNFLVHPCTTICTFFRCWRRRLLSRLSWSWTRCTTRSTTWASTPCSHQSSRSSPSSTSTSTPSSVSRDPICLSLYAKIFALAIWYINRTGVGPSSNLAEYISHPCSYSLFPTIPMLQPVKLHSIHTYTHLHSLSMSRPDSVKSALRRIYYPSFIDKEMVWSSQSLLDPEMEVKWAWILLKGAICMLLLASLNMQSPSFSPPTQEDRTRSRSKRIFFCKHCPRWIMFPPPFLYLSAVVNGYNNTVGLAALCWQIHLKSI